MKGRLFERVFSRALRAAGRPSHLMVTNLGVRSALRCEMPISKPSYLFGRPENATAERASLTLAKTLATDCDHFLDVGANEGIYTFLVGEAVGSGIGLHWFEPDHDLGERLHRNLARNGVSARGNRAAAAAETGEAVFFRNHSDDASGSLTDFFSTKHMTSPEPVRTIALSEYLRANEVQSALVKIDVEGAGAQVWSGASSEVSRVKYFLMEMLEPEIRARLPATLIAEGGLNAYYIRDYDLVQSTSGEFDYVAPFWNWLFCRLSPPALRDRLAGTPFRVVKAN
jgi:FkbM family methyltransferase